MKKTKRNACPSCGKFNGHELRCATFRADNQSDAPEPDPSSPSEQDLEIVREVAGMTEEELSQCSPEMIRFAVDRLVAKSPPS